MKVMRWLLIPAALLVVLPPIDGFAQQRQVVRQISGDDVKGQPFNIGELGALILNMKDTLKVLGVSPGEMRLKAYESIDLKEGDVIVMVNGKRAKGTEDLQAAYEATEVGKNYELGIKRGDKMMIVAFAKADAKDLPKPKMMMMTQTADGSGESHMSMNGMKMDIPEGITEVTPIPGLGLIVGMKNEKPVIAGILPPAKDDQAFAKIQPGDVIVSCEGKPVTKAADVATAFESVKEGAKFSFVLHRGGDEFAISKVKEAEQGGWKVKEK